MTNMRYALSFVFLNSVYAIKNNWGLFLVKVPVLTETVLRRPELI